MRSPRYGKLKRWLDRCNECPLVTVETHLENTCCPLCESTGGTCVGRKVNGGHLLPTVSCLGCGTVYLAKRWSNALLEAAYAAEFAEGATSLALPIREGALDTSDPGFSEVATAWYKGRATHAVALGAMQHGDRVLEIGSGAGETLALQRQMLEIRAQGVDSLAERVARAEACGIQTACAPLTNMTWPSEPVDVIQSFHHLQRVPNPLEYLRRAWLSLKAGGRIVIEVPNVCHPYGAFEDTFLRATDLTYFSESTLTALMRRSGFALERTVDSLTLFVVGRKDVATRPIRDFTPALLTQPEHDAAWISARLATYSKMEQLRAHILDQGPDVDALHQLVHQLLQPAFAWHVVDVVLNLVEFFMGHQAVGLACLTATAAADGPYEPELTERLGRLAQVIRRDGVAAVGLRPSTAEVAPTKTLARNTQKEDTVNRSSKFQDSGFSALMAEIRGQHQHQTLGGMLGSFSLTPRAVPVAQA